MATSKKRRERWYSLSIGGIRVGADMGGFNDEDPIDAANATRMIKNMFFQRNTAFAEDAKLTFLGFNYDVACQIVTAPLEKDTNYRAWKESNLRWKGVQDDK